MVAVQIHSLKRTADTAVLSRHHHDAGTLTQHDGSAAAADSTNTTIVNIFLPLDTKTLYNSKRGGFRSLLAVDY